MRRTVDLQAEVSRWTEQHGCSLRVLNEGQHWLFQKPGFTAEWWPSSAKLVLNRDYLHDHHAPHWGQVAATLEAALAPPSRSRPAAASPPCMLSRPGSGPAQDAVQALLGEIKARLPGLVALFEKVSSHGHGEAFFHARTMLELVVRYGRELEQAPNVLPSGWAAVLYLYNLR